MMSTDKFHNNLTRKVDEFTHAVYRLTKYFPREEIFGASSQLRRAALSVALNYTEGFARRRKLVKINFFEISYGSLQESKYLIRFSHREGWVSKEHYEHVMKIGEEIGAMPWRTIENLNRDS